MLCHVAPPLLSRPILLLRLLRFSLAIVAVAITANLSAGLLEPAAEIDSHVFLADLRGEMRPIVGATSRGVKVLLSDGSTKLVSASRYQALPKTIPSAGRVTVYESGGLSGQSIYGSAEFTSARSSTEFYFKLISDRDLKDVYAVIFFTDPNDENASERMTFCRLGDLPEGEVVERTGRLSGLIDEELGKRSRYRFELFSEGLAIEDFQLPGVAFNPRSRGLLIPWEDRMKVFSEASTATQKPRPPQPFIISFRHLDKEALKARGIDELRVTLTIAVDGTVNLREVEGALEQDERSLLETEVGNWRFFPAVKDGQPLEATATVPLRL